MPPQNTTVSVRDKSEHHLYCTHPLRIPYIQPVNQILCLWPVRMLPLLDMSSQYTLAPAHIQSAHHFSYPCPVTMPTLLPKSSQYTIWSDSSHVQSEYHLSFPCPNSTPSLLAHSPQIDYEVYFFLPNFLSLVNIILESIFNDQCSICILFKFNLIWLTCLLSWGQRSHMWNENYICVAQLPTCCQYKLRSYLKYLLVINFAYLCKFNLK